jgi:N-acetylmuramoyl-L-alanine amidase
VLFPYFERIGMAQASFFRMWVSVSAAVLAASLLAATVLAASTEAQDTTPALAGKTIILDPGHGGGDTGATNANGLTEKDQNLLVAYELRVRLWLDGATVYMTRGGDPSSDAPGADDCYPDDATLSNNARYTCANSKASPVYANNILVSIHMNGSSDASKDYTTSLYGKPSKDRALALAIFNNGLTTLKVTTKEDYSTDPPTIGEAPIARRNPYQFASGVLLKSKMAAALAESVFITSTSEGKWLKEGRPTIGGVKVDRREEIATALEKGIMSYFYPG